MAGWRPIFKSSDAPENDFENAYAARLACSIYKVLRLMYAVGEWSFDFVKQCHTNNARTWMQYATKSRKQ